MERERERCTFSCICLKYIGKVREREWDQIEAAIVNALVTNATGKGKGEGRRVYDQEKRFFLQYTGIMMKRERDRIEAAIVNVLVVITIRREGGERRSGGCQDAQHSGTHPSTVIAIYSFNVAHIEMSHIRLLGSA